jgi:ABC-type bacteriocin/lantibiotic exporter with double-glycine peptidase domain
MKGNYFVLGPGREYKHLYFNFTPAMLFLFAWSMFHWNMLMAFANRVLKAGLSGNLRVLVLIFAMLSFMQVVRIDMATRFALRVCR